MGLVGGRSGGVRVGLQKTSTVDFPGRLSATLFFSGCNLRCPYCHNPQLAHGNTPTDFIALNEALAFLARRSTVLDGVCLTGGEPLLQPELPEIVDRIRDLGFAVKIDTNGFQPSRLPQCEADYVALDIKTAPSRYGELGERAEFDLVRRTMEYLRSADLGYEYRTTVVPRLVGSAEVRAIIDEIEVGERWYLQRFRPGEVLAPSFAALLPPSTDEMEAIRDAAKRHGIDCRIRA